MQMSCGHKSLVNWNKLKLQFIISLDFKVDSIHCELQMKPVVGHSLSYDVKSTWCQLPVEILLSKISVLYSKNVPLFIISKERFPHAVRPPANYIANSSLESRAASGRPAPPALLNCVYDAAFHHFTDSSWSSSFWRTTVGTTAWHLK